MLIQRQLENIYGFKDKILNQFKCITYHLNIDNVVKYYENDQFCIDYCIGDDEDKYGCNTNDCPFQHSQRINSTNLIWENKQIINLSKYYVSQQSCLLGFFKKIW